MDSAIQTQQGHSQLMWSKGWSKEVGAGVQSAGTRLASVWALRGGGGRGRCGIERKEDG